jgi:molecular chaperone DnaK (HSP70)
MAAVFAVGIDLGTTHTALGAVALNDEGAVPTAFAVPQVVAANEVQARSLLPSFLYLPTTSEVGGGAVAVPWDTARTFAVGAFARDRAAAVPGRVISSAKSWLSHAGVDRRAAILPFGTADDDVPHLSPVEVQTRLLAHVREAWDAAHPSAPLAEQHVVLTVPASFDVVAKSLTEEAAVAAGLRHVVLLEEPQAALYAWIARHADASPSPWRKQVGPGDLILVVDIGGGTTDFSLIAVADDAGSLGLERVAVGDHILLGGDNMDLALAYAVKERLEADGRTIDDWQLRALTHSCRGAKEQLLQDAALEAATVVIPGRGSKLVGGSIKSTITRKQLTALVVDGFLPLVDVDARPQQARRAGLQTLGLPWAADAAITRHLAAFVAGKKPTAVLFNGGVSRSDVVRARVLEVMARWWGAAPRVLDGADLDLAVATGAASYARVRASKRGLRIKGGTARAYYVGIEKSELAVPGIAPRVDAVCIAPRGMEEGSEAALQSTLGLLVGEPAVFRFFSSTVRDADTVGTSIDVARAKDQLVELSSIVTTLRSSHGTDGAVVAVTLRSRVSETGTLELFAHEAATSTSHKLEFEIRDH